MPSSPAPRAAPHAQPSRPAALGRAPASRLDEARGRRRPARHQLVVACRSRRRGRSRSTQDLVGAADRREPVRDQEDQPPRPHAARLLEHARARSRRRARRSARRGSGSACPSGPRARSRGAGAGRSRAWCRARRAACRSPRAALDELVGAGDARGLAHRGVGRVRHGVADVLADRRAERAGSPGARSRRPRAGSSRSEAAQVRRRRSRSRPASGSKRRSSSAISVLLPEPVGPDDRGDRPDARLEVDALERGAVGLVAEAHALEAHAAADRRAAGSRPARPPPRARGRAARTRGRGRSRCPAPRPRCGRAGAARRRRRRSAA